MDLLNDLKMIDRYIDTFQRTLTGISLNVIHIKTDFSISR